MAFEEKFNIQIPEEDAQKLDTVGKAIAYLEEKLKAQ
jgi:acyl carrier protein